MTRAPRPFLRVSLACLAATALAGGCGEPPPEPAAAGYEPRAMTRADLAPEGEVQETDDGFHVAGALTLRTAHGDARRFEHADLDVGFDAQGRLVHVSGRAEVPSPHERLRFEDPVHADVGFFSGRALNARGDLPIRLQDDTDYFVFHVGAALEMRVATGETDPEAAAPIVVKAPLGGSVLLVVDYDDPMYFVHGAQDLLGEAGFGRSLHGRIPFEAWRPVAGLGRFDGTETIVGTFPLMKALSVSGQRVDRMDVAATVSAEDPAASTLAVGREIGVNGAMSLDLFVKDVVGIDLPLGRASAGLWGEVSTDDVFEGHAYVSGTTETDLSWWPAFVPAKPVAALETNAHLETRGDFSVEIAGEFGWDLPTGRHSMAGAFELTPEAMRLEGRVRSGRHVLALRGTVTAEETTVSMPAPGDPMEIVREHVLAQVDREMAAAEEAYQDLVDATADYEWELSLRGLRSGLPGVLRRVQATARDQIEDRLRPHRGKIYYGSLRDHVWDVADDHLARIDTLIARLEASRDDETTRRLLEAALRAVAAYEVLDTTYTYRFAFVTKSVRIRQRLLSAAFAQQLRDAADGVRRIDETWRHRLRMQDVYDAIPAQELFENLRAGIEEGVADIPSLDEVGFVVPHDGSPIEVYAIVGGEEWTLSDVDPLDPASFLGHIAERLVDDLL